MKRFLISIFTKKTKETYPDKAEGYPYYLEKSREMGKDINDYLDNDLGWLKPLPVLEEVLFPLLEDPKNVNILELGPGTGRWTRHILKKLDQQCKIYTLVDHSNWMIEFLKEYFKNEGRFEFIKNNGTSLPVESDKYDVIFSQGVLIELKPSFIYLYAQEFSRVLKNNGICVFDYFNFDYKEGWDYFIEETKKGNIYYTYYSDQFIDKVFEQAGFSLEKRFTYGKANYVVLRKVK